MAMNNASLEWLPTNGSAAFSSMFFNRKPNAMACKTVWWLLEKKQEWTLLLPVRIGFISIYVIIFLLGMIGNLAMIYSILKRKRFKNVSNFFLMNLAICNVMLCVTAIPMAPLVFFAYNWHLGLALCKLMPFCQATSVIVTQLSLCSVALDRFRNIVYPQKRNWSLATAMAITAGNWLLAGIFNVPLIIAHKLIVHKNICGEFCMETWTFESNWFKNFNPDQYKHYYGIVTLALTYVGPLLLQSCCFERMLIHVQWTTVKDPQDRSAANKKRQVVYSLMMMLAFAFSWLPLTMVNVLRDWNVNWAFLNYQPFMFQLAAHCIAMTSVIWNPLLYFWMIKPATVIAAPNETTQLSNPTGTIGSGFNPGSCDWDNNALINTGDNERDGLLTD